jgi:hypothetical protein
LGLLLFELERNSRLAFPIMFKDQTLATVDLMPTAAIAADDAQKTRGQNNKISPNHTQPLNHGDVTQSGPMMRFLSRAAGPAPRRPATPFIGLLTEAITHRFCVALRPQSVRST